MSLRYGLSRIIPNSDKILIALKRLVPLYHNEKENKKIMKLFEFIIVTTKESAYGYSEIKPRIVCNDGFNMSVQAGKGLYSTPRQTVKEYSHVEIGFPSQEEPLISEYAETGDLTDTVYLYVPIDIVERVIEKHGGLNIKETFINS